MSARRVVIDCDPGVDDALALLLALAAPDELEVVAITTVAGNVPLAKTAANARRVLELVQRTEIAVHAGADRPLLRPAPVDERIHGESGLDGADLPPPSMPLADEHAALALGRILNTCPSGTVTLCPTGPLTNLALAFRLAPEAISRVREIVLMGGAAGDGNITPSAEFNIHTDPHAARIVFEAGVPIVMLGLDVTRQAVVTAARVARLRANGNHASEAAADLLAFYNRRHPEGAAPLHDPCVIAYLLRPGLFQGREARVEVETESRLALGRTVVDFRRRGGLAANARVIERVDADGFFALLTKRLGCFA